MTAATTSPRSPIRAVAMPSEHGGWGLTIEPGLLGLLVGPSIAGACIAAAAVMLFVIRTPVELALIDRRRKRRLPRTRLAEQVAAVEALLLAALVAVAALTAEGGNWWIPALVAAPLVALELSYDIRSRRRRLIPELAGAVAIGATASSVVLAADGDTALAAGLWLIMAARSLTSIPHVRHQIARVHHRNPGPRLTTIVDLMSVAVAATAVVLVAELLLGALAVAALVAFQLLRRQRPVAPVKLVGITQMLLGLAVVIVTAIGVWLG